MQASRDAAIVQVCQSVPVLLDIVVVSCHYILLFLQIRLEQTQFISDLVSLTLHLRLIVEGSLLIGMERGDDVRILVPECLERLYLALVLDDVLVSGVSGVSYLW